jgi:PIN domain nuclease of toxin-antitoxin system
VIALDTHALLWWTLDPGRLGKAASRAIDSADTLGIPAIVFWEVALLSRKKRIDLGTTLSEWAQEVISIPRVQPLDLTAEIALAAESLKMHADPADRFIVATAIHYRSALVTGDVSIRRTKLLTTLW